MKIKLDIHGESFIGTLTEIIGNCLLIIGVVVLIQCLYNRTMLAIMITGSILLMLAGLGLRKLAASILARKGVIGYGDNKPTPKGAIRKKATMKTTGRTSKKN